MEYVAQRCRGSRLFNQHQLVNYSGISAKEFEIHRGVPQGLILGLTLFILLLDDIDWCLHHCDIIKYTSLHYIRWFAQNDLSLNLKISKTESMLFRTASKLRKSEPLLVPVSGTKLNCA